MSEIPLRYGTIDKGLTLVGSAASRVGFAAGGMKKIRVVGTQQKPAVAIGQVYDQQSTTESVIGSMTGPKSGLLVATARQLVVVYKALMQSIGVPERGCP